MMKKIRNNLRKHWFNTTVTLLVYPTWVVCDFLGETGMENRNATAIREELAHYENSNVLYKALRYGKYTGLRTDLNNSMNEVYDTND